MRVLIRTRWKEIMTPSDLQVINQRWLDPGVGLRDAAIAAFERRYRVRLPAALRSFYQLMDGMSPGCWDDELNSFWPLSEVGPVPEKVAGFRGTPDYGDIEQALPEAASWFAFAD